MIQEHEKPWRPLTPTEVHDLFAAAPFPWWIAGGYAIELAVGAPVRPHDDIDVLILRRDHPAVRQWLRSWECWVAMPPGRLRPWPIGEVLPLEGHDVWCRETATGPWRVQLMIDEQDSATGGWRSRRDARVTRALAHITRRTEDGWPYLAPEVQLYYKARRPRPKDELDLNAVVSRLDPGQRAWLRDAIARSYGPDHPWRPRLGDGTAEQPSRRPGG